MDRKQAIDFLIERPAAFARLVGFSRLDDLHNRWIVEMLRGQDDKTLQASRGTYKTTSVSVALALICILLPNKRTMFMRKTDNDVKEVIKQVQKILLDPHTQYLVNCIYGVNLSLVVQSSTEVSTNLTRDNRGTSQLIGIGMGASITGKHFDRIFTDDIVNVQDRLSKAERDKTKTIYQELQNIKNRGGRIFNTGTPWHKEDAFTIMPTAERFDCYHPEIQKIISKQELEEIRAKMSPSLFAANYELQHIAAENALFETAPKFFKDSELLANGIAHIDAAYGGEDYTAFTCGKRIGEKLYLFGKMWHTHVDVVLDRILSESERLKCAPVYCEDNADKGFLSKEIRQKRPNMLVRMYHEKENKYQKISEYLRKWWPNIEWLEGTDPEYIAQIMDYTEEAEHDDAPDSAALWGGNKMINLRTLEVAGIGPAIHAMRNPYDSWEKSDTVHGKIGEKDRELSERLSNAGTEHCKHLRLCMVWVEIEAPLYWWKEFDTYRTGVEKLSCSTMHTITKKSFTKALFTNEVNEGTINWLELQRGFFLVAENEASKRIYWRKIIENLPSGFIQRRTVMLSYAALRQICKQRKGHKLSEWRDFIEWAEGLPEGWMITEKEGEKA